ncbi:MAG: 3'-5' exonuclease [Patescibacteria group bacterium]|nr:3'-5' exonuclease [Patescibacteria group bacterium]
MLKENQFLLTQGLVFVDLETTGLEPGSDRIIEIGIIKVRDGKVVGKYQTLINPQKPIPADATRISGIGDAEVATAPKFGDVAEQIVRFFDTGLLVAHNADFDYGFLKTELEHNGFSFGKPTLDTMQLSKFFYPTQTSHRLDMVAQKHNIRIRTRHRALDDARALHKFYNKLVEKFGADRVQEVILKFVQHRTAKGPNGVRNQDTLL